MLNKVPHKLLNIHRPPPPPTFPPWTANQHFGPPAQFGYMQQQSPSRQWVPPPPPVPPGQPGSYQFTSPNGMPSATQQPSHPPYQPPMIPQTYQQSMSSQQQRPPTPTQQPRQLTAAHIRQPTSKRQIYSRLYIHIVLNYC